MQYKNYDKLMEYINSHPELNAEVQFGTLVIFYLLIKKENLIILEKFYLFNFRRIISILSMRIQRV